MYFFSNSPVKWRCKSGQDQNAILNTILKFISPSRKWFCQFLHHRLHNKITCYQEWFREISGEADARTRMNRKSITGGKDRVRTWDFEPDWRRKRTKDKLEGWDGLLFSHDEFSRVFESEEGKTSIRWKNERVQRVKIRFGVNVAEFSQRLRFLSSFCQGPGPQCSACVYPTLSSAGTLQPTLSVPASRQVKFWRCQDVTLGGYLRSNNIIASTWR